jgi:2-dehydro-3-deoxyphosphooctonate aldolase (KDO 8-P synthase)
MNTVKNPKTSPRKKHWLSHVGKNNNERLFFILGPCVIENELHSLKSAEFLTKLSEKLKFNLIFKSSFDKANRTSLDGFRSIGIERGLRVLEKVRSQFGVPIITDIHETWQANPVGAIVDVIQIPALLCRQTDLLIAAGKTKKNINIKKGQFVAAEAMMYAFKKISSTGNNNVWLCERGTSFGYNNLIVDYRNFSIMKKYGLPIIFDATHSIQRPSSLGSSSGGDRQLVPALAAAAVAQEISGIFMEVHENPEKAACDGPNSIRFSDLEALLRYLIALDTWVKGRKIPKVI